jgi:hypothetical protein
MPGFDGTGPKGQGPLSGGGRGPCNPNSRPVGKGLRRGLGARGVGKSKELESIVERLNKLEERLNEKI